MFEFLESIDFQMYYPLIELSYLAIFKVFGVFFPRQIHESNFWFDIVWPQAKSLWRDLAV